MAEKNFEKAVVDRLSFCGMDDDKLRYHVRDIVELQKRKIDILDVFPEGQPNPFEVGVITRTKVDGLQKVLETVSSYPRVRKIELFPYGIPFPIWLDVKILFSDQFQNRI